MAKIYRASGEVIETDTELNLQYMQWAVGGFVERIFHNEHIEVYADEEGALKRSPINPAASTLVGFYVFGDVLVTKVGEVE